MSNRQVLLYFAWSRPAETGAPLAVIDDRFPAVFELRRLFYPKFESLSGRDDVDPGIGGFLDHIQKPNFAAFAERAEALTGNPTIQAERVGDDGAETLLDAALIADADTIVVISFDSFRTDQAAAATEIEAIRRFLENPDHLIFVCPHHDIGEATDAAASAISMCIVAERASAWPGSFRVTVRRAHSLRPHPPLHANPVWRNDARDGAMHHHSDCAVPAAGRRSRIVCRTPRDAAAPLEAADRPRHPLRADRLVSRTLSLLLVWWFRSPPQCERMP